MKDFYGLPVRVIEQGKLRLVCLAETGPRIVGLFHSSIGGNLLAETPDIVQQTPFGDYPLYGGHRLWEAPETEGVTGLPEGKQTVEGIDSGIRLSSEVNAIGIQKIIELRFAEADSVQLTHWIANLGNQPRRLAAWAITQLRPGGTVVLPFSSATGKNPNRNLVLWPYSEWHPEAFGFVSGRLEFDPRPVQKPFKFGAQAEGSVAIQYAGYKFTKHFNAANGEYADRNCNVEVYVDAGYIELETLSAVKQLEPGQTVSHTETWQLTTS
jgi:hypothetical protein